MAHNSGPNISQDQTRADCARNSQCGQSLVEFALSSMLFLMTLLGIFEFGLAVFQYNIVSDLAQEGARWASVRGAGSGGLAASEANVQTFVRARALALSPTVETYSVNPTTKACTTTHVDPSSLFAGSGLCVKVTKSFAPLTQIIPLSATLGATAQMIVAR
jgi:Flp pilus assembly protein TadG